MNEKTAISRREFLKVSTAAGTGLLISVYLSGCKSEATPTPPSAAVAEPTALPPNNPTALPTSEPSALPAATAVPEPTAWFEPNMYVQIDNMDQVTITASRMEMGQGVRTALAMILAEELEADWSSIQVTTAQADGKYGRQLTGGSQSIEQLFIPLRQAGAVAREMLLAAAAQIWGVEPGDCSAENGVAHHLESGRQLTYGELVETAATLPVPRTSDIPLKDPKDFRLIGTPKGQIDESRLVDGSAIYGMDVRLPDMRYAVIARPPVISGRVESFDASAALAISGVRDVLELDGGVAVVADNTWAAIQGRKALTITWDDGRLAETSSEDTRQRQVGAVQSDLTTVEAERLTAVYEMPYLAHAAMEPLNCTADVRTDSCVIWVPTQNPRDAKNRAIAITRLPSDAVTVNVTMIGGGFGRRLEVDYVDEAVGLSQAVNAPVQVVWTREDDMRHDYYHPLTIIGCRERPNLPDPASIRLYPASGDVHTGNWRAVTNIPDAFGHECFVDELAAAQGRDPYELRRELLPERERAVLDLAADKAGWGMPLPEGQGRGIAFHSTWGLTHVAQVAEVSVADDGAIRVQRIVCAIDCGIVVNPDMVAAQMEGGIVFGLSALKGEIVVENGRVRQSNFHDYPILRLDEMPQIEVYIVPSNEMPQGVGEMGTPPVLPAVANAVFAATGKRIRRLPL
jgi:isoquinoline 1-oxidoreductase beta subunit